jgi:hypothetical protein
MKKIILSLALAFVLYFSARPYVRVIVDDDIAGVITRTSVHHKFETLAVWRW